MGLDIIYICERDCIERLGKDLLARQLTPEIDDYLLLEKVTHFSFHSRKKEVSVWVGKNGTFSIRDADENPIKTKYDLLPAPHLDAANLLVISDPFLF